MKTRKVFLSLLLLFVAAQGTYAANFEVDGIYYSILSQADYTCKVTYKSTSYNSYSGDIVIPEKITYNGHDYDVEQIDSKAFYNCKSLNSVSFPTSLQSIGSYAFYGCVLLSTVSLPASLTSIGDHCFDGCSALQQINLAKCQTIGQYAFNGCKLLATLSVPNSVTKISDFAFNNCTSLTQVTFEDGASELSLGRSTRPYAGNTTSASLFKDCPLDSIYIGRDISIYYTFLEHGTLRSVYFSDSVSTIAEDMFRRCANLQNVYGLNCAKEIGDEAFSDCTGLKCFVIPNSVTTLGEFVFKNCTSLETLVIGDGITTLSAQQRIIYGCKNLKKLYLGKGLQTIENSGLGYIVNTSDDWKIREVYLFSNVLNDVYYANSGKYTAFPTAATVFVANPDRYETLLGSTYTLKSLLSFNETSLEYGSTPELTYNNNVVGMTPSFDNKSLPKDAGSYNTELNVTFTGTNFDWSATIQIPCTYTVTKAPLSIMANNAQRYYGEDNPELTCEYVGFKNSETIDVLNALPTVYTTATKDSYVGTYPIYCTGAEAKNYTVTMQNGTLTINKAPQTITWEQDFMSAHVGDMIELTATCSSGLAVKYRSSDTSSILITTKNGKQYAFILKEGYAAITAYQNGDANHEAAEEVSLLVSATTTGIDNINAKPTTNATYYNISGQRIKKPTSGLVIKRNADGSTQKVVVK